MKNNQEHTQFRVVMSTDILKKFTAYIMSVSYEISGLGELEVFENRQGVDFIIKDLHLLKQVSSGTSTVLDATSIGLLMASMITKKKDLSSLKLWWHSHGILNVFWSGIDARTIDDFNDGKKEWMLSIVGNRQQHILARLDIYRPFRLTYDNIAIVVVPDIDHNYQNMIDGEVDQKVRFVEPVVPPTQSFPFSNKDWELIEQFERGDFNNV